jgi:hypothetical protein
LRYLKVGTISNIIQIKVLRIGIKMRDAFTGKRNRRRNQRKPKSEMRSFGL